MLLAIDTATQTASLALYNADGVQVETTWHARENHTVELMVQIIHLLELGHTLKSDLRAIGVAQGPGSFTGLRVGMSVAKGLAFGCHIPLLAVPTLDVIAHAHAYQYMPMWVVLTAGRGRFSVARYSARHGECKRISEYNLLDVAGLIAMLQQGENTQKLSRVYLCGDVDATITKALSECGIVHAVIASPAMNGRRAGFLAELAWKRFLTGEADDPASLAPMYMPHMSVEGSNQIPDKKAMN